ncbi:MAG: VOC family protein [bacterium]|nr:VOC family protein [bacterium]
MQVKQLDHLNLTVRNFDETVAFYGRVFGFELVEENVRDDGVRWGVIRAGEAMLCIYEHPGAEHLDRFTRLDRGLHGLNHFALRITDGAAFEAVARREGLELHHGGRVRYPHSDSWYVTDPTGYEIEVSCWHDDEIKFDRLETVAGGQSAGDS